MIQRPSPERLEEIKEELAVPFKHWVTESSDAWKDRETIKELFAEIDMLRAEKQESYDISTRYLDSDRSAWRDSCIKAEQERDRYKEALEATALHWFDPTKDGYACIGCDLHCGNHQLGHDATCCVEIAHKALEGTK